jgi:tyrosine decarboxylase / aspartate 1-decarboxylase
LRESSFPEDSLSEEEVIRILKEMKGKDLPYDRFFSTMCTRPHSIAVKAHSLFLETNLGDPGLFPGAAEIEARTVKMISQLLGYPDAVGYISTGGTESNIQAIRAARSVSQIKGGNIVVPASAHFSFDKIADLLNLEVRKADLDENLRADLSSVESLVDDHTAAVVGIAGTTEFGQVDPIDRLGKIASDRGIHLHVDAAFGGFVLPFLDHNYKWDFRVDAVSSITIDPHKMGMSTIPAGGLFFRTLKNMSALEADTHYLTVARQASLTGTRTGAAAAATYAVMMHLGKSGFKNIVNYCMDLTWHLVAGCQEFGVYPVIDPIMNVVALEVRSPVKVRSELFKLGWHVSLTREPHRALRLILMPHMTHKNVEMFLGDLKKILKTCEK